MNNPFEQTWLSDFPSDNTNLSNYIQNNLKSVGVFNQHETNTELYCWFTVNSEVQSSIKFLKCPQALVVIAANEIDSVFTLTELYMTVLFERKCNIRISQNQFFGKSGFNFCEEVIYHNGLFKIYHRMNPGQLLVNITTKKQLLLHLEPYNNTLDEWQALITVNYINDYFLDQKLKEITWKK
jgi:hypothetical protein